ncbi:hypothetical protein [Streptomyces sp. JJ36]|uniref:hypothetical protein n=1 Tax=Streptomyces sp. JJ36 TaxID=2736645 RepID=UPI001F2D026B|nr:hypothetical protein [Streptomyces sp. JJ36]MCF6522724.1 hypothetical protein [Streptomyces sp. JJ36]
MNSASVSASALHAAPVALQLAREAALEPDLSMPELHDLAVDIALSFSTGSVWDDLKTWTPVSDREAVERLAAFLESERQWWSPLEELTFPQVVVAENGTPVHTLRPPRLREDDPTYPDKPAGALWTSSLLPTGAPTWTAVVDTGYLGFDRPFTGIDLLMDGSGCDVFTIASAADFATLCEEFAAPRPQGAPGIDWHRVTASYHAVHLTFTGLLLAQEAPVHTRFGPMRLRGWDCESTAWLRLPDSARLGEHRHVT